MKVIPSLILIVLSAVPGVLLSWTLLAPLQLSGVLGALAHVVLAMVFAVAIFAGVIALGKALKILK